MNKTMSKHAAATLSTQLHMLDASESGGASQSQNEQRRLLQLSRLCLLAADIIKPHNLWHLTRYLLPLLDLMVTGSTKMAVVPPAAVPAVLRGGENVMLLLSKVTVN